MAYGYPWSRLSHDFKFQAEPGLVRTFATLLRAAPWVEPLLDAADLVLPMPLSQERLKQRGYNPVSYTHLDVYKRQLSDCFAR